MWQKLKRLMGRRDPRLAIVRPSNQRPEYPASLLLASRPRPPAREQLVFDPALMHFTNGFRLLDPPDLPADGQTVWLRARDDAMNHLLRLIVTLPAGANLVLRGSVPMRAWFGTQARVPRDIDWIVRPMDIAPASRWSEQLFTGLLAAIAARPEAGSAILAPESAAYDEIWTYERAEGRRLTVPWRTADGLRGSAQMDVVFREPLPEEPITCVIPVAGGQDLVVSCASRTTSLAWKLLWLATDICPQGKDLYDAVLLAESTKLPAGLVARVFAAARANCADLQQLTTKRMLWDEFIKEYPGLAGDATVWRQRLALALAAMPEWDAAFPASG